MFALNTVEPGCWPSFVLSLEGERQLAARHRQLARAGHRPAGAVAISLHAHHVDLVAGLLEALAAAGLADADLWISTDSPAKADAIQRLLLQAPAWAPERCRVQVMANRGRNVLPLLHQLHHHLQPYGAVLHLHTKRSGRSAAFGDAWRGDLVEKLIGSPAQVALALALLADPAVGLVLPCRHGEIDPYYKWASEFPRARELLAELCPDRRLSPSQLLVFPAGMMFWCRPACLRSLAQFAVVGPLAGSFEPEPLPNRATLPHAIERILCHVCEAEGYGWRLLDRPSTGSETPAEAEAVLPVEAAGAAVSVWGDGDGAYHRELAALTSRLQELERQRRRRSRAQAVLAPLGPRRPFTLGVLPRYGPGDDLGPGVHGRLLRPLAPALRAGRCRLLLPDDPADPALAACDVLLAQAGAVREPAQVRQWQRRCRRHGIPLVVDLDDGLGMPQGPDDGTEALLAAADHLLAASPELLAAWSGRRAGTGRPAQGTVLASGLDLELWGRPRRPPARQPGEPLRILCIGLPGADRVLAPLLEPLDALQERRPGRFQLVVVGSLVAPPQRDWLTRLELPRGQRSYPAIVQALRAMPPCHVGVAPVHAQPPSVGATDLAALELAALGLPCLCAAGEPHGLLIRRGAAIAVDPGGWGEALERLIDRPDPLEPVARAAWSYLQLERRSERMGRRLLRLLRRL